MLNKEDTIVKIKICGITNLDDARAACDAGADYVGFVLAKASPRFITPDKAAGIVAKLPADVGKVGLFRDEELEKVVEIVLFCGFDHIQLHGLESPVYCRKLKNMLAFGKYKAKLIKTFRVKDGSVDLQPAEYKEVDHYLFDTYHPDMIGGTGIKFDWNVLGGLKLEKPFFLAGGLTPENVAEAIKTAHPFAVDVSSGVEEKIGKKDRKKMEEFIKNAKNA